MEEINKSFCKINILIYLFIKKKTHIHNSLWKKYFTILQNSWKKKIKTKNQQTTQYSNLLALSSISVLYSTNKVVYNNLMTFSSDSCCNTNLPQTHADQLVGRQHQTLSWNTVLAPATTLQRNIIL